MDDISLMRIVERLANLLKNGYGVFDWQRYFWSEQVTQRTTNSILRDQVGAAFAETKIDQRKNMGMLQHGQELRL